MLSCLWGHHPVSSLIHQLAYNPHLLVHLSELRFKRDGKRNTWIELLTDVPMIVKGLVDG